MCDQVHGLHRQMGGMLGLWRASQNRDVTPAAWITRTGRRVQAFPPQSGVLACNNHNITLYQHYIHKTTFRAHKTMQTFNKRQCLKFDDIFVAIP